LNGEADSNDIISVRYSSHRGGHLIRSDTDDIRFRVLAAGGALALFAVILWLRFREAPAPPPLPPRPAPVRREALREMEFSRNVYEAGVLEDAAQFGTTASPGDLGALLAHQTETLKTNLEPGGAPVDVARLRLSAKIVTLDTASGAGTIPIEHIVLRIENLTEAPLAYRVETQAARECGQKADLAHDAIAIAPRGAIERTECMSHSRGDLVAVRLVETLALPSLSFFYVSMLYPPHVGGDARSTRGHRPPKGEICHNIPEQAIRQGLDRGQTTWRDVVDFYARHNCQRYMFPLGYRAFTKSGERSLPVAPQEIYK
jgi:hypothetical protein